MKLLCIVPLVILFCFTLACQDKAAKADTDRAEIVKAVNAAADNLASAISRLDAEEVTNLFSKADGTKYISDGAFIPRDDLRETFRAFYGSLKEMNFTFERIVFPLPQIPSRDDIGVAT